MPTDAKGKYHMNAQRAMASDKHGGIGTAVTHKGSFPKGGADSPEHDSTAAASPHQAIHDGLRAAQAEHGGKHMHISHDGMGGMQSHHVGEDGEPQGPHDHVNLEALKQHMDQFFSEEGNEY